MKAAPPRVTSVGFALLLLTLNSSARADVVSSPLANPPLCWFFGAGFLAFLLFVFGVFVFIVTPQREP